MPRPSNLRKGNRLRHQPRGIPLFYLGKRIPRVVTSDPWAFLRHKSRIDLTKDHAARATAFIDQAFDFFEAASNPRTSSRPLLYYYSFLNLAKVLLLHRKIALPLLVRHGLKDPGANIKKRLRFEGQRVLFVRPRPDHSELFPEFLTAMGGSLSLCDRSYRVIDMMEQIPGIHRTSCSVSEHEPRFCPIKAVEFRSSGKKVWALLEIEKSDKDAKSAFPQIRRSQRFSKVFYQVVSEESEKPRKRKTRRASDFIRFETEAVRGQRRGIDGAVLKLSNSMRPVGVSAILTRDGYRYYLADFPPRNLMPQLCSVYAVMFYLGSITRYKPHYFDAIVTRGYEWLVAEFLETQPTQFLHLLASHIAGVEVVKPYATVSHG